MPTTYTPKTIIEGDDLMLFINSKSIAYATSHTLTLTMETASINSKDHGVYSAATPQSRSWEITSDKKDVRQTAYQIVVCDDQGEVWNTGKVESDQQLWIPYAGKKLTSGTFCTWKVKVWTTAGESAWSSDECFSIGLLDEGIYFVRISCSEGVVSKRIVKQ